MRLLTLTALSQFKFQMCIIVALLTTMSSPVTGMKGQTACMRALVPRFSTQGRAGDVNRAPLVCAAGRSQDDHRHMRTTTQTDKHRINLQ